MAQAAAVQRSATAGDTRALELPNAISSVPTARHAVAHDLHSAGLAATLVDSVLVVVTELVSNALQHARPVRLTESHEGVLLRWTVVNRHVLIDVTDGGGTGQPQLQHATPAAPQGRGLAMVEALASHWSVRTDNGRVTVQAVVGP
ncbi:ATP-binding protein [Phytoactinopolyspora limicola]|uniref:ATP-binding protein n=1 Tax=Phytoactinopolyspora limicola TaxID=2715536 RepID=UPI00140B851C|nr:ATP-binding protein [Phytoactinopolyspora limicola]